MTYEIKCVESREEKEKLARELLANLRQVDIEEMEGLGIDKSTGVNTSIFCTDKVYYGRRTDNGRLGVVWGIQFFKDGDRIINLIWCLGTDEIKHVRKTFMKESKKILMDWMDKYGQLMNTVGTFNLDAIAWLTWLGAEFFNRRIINGREFTDFVLKKKEA